ncbi:MAG: MBOAT family protein [Planctomycetaceae bacterium]
MTATSTDTPRIRDPLTTIFVGFGVLTIVLLVGIANAVWPRWVVMWLLALAVFAVCKWLTWHAANIENTPTAKRIAYFAVWPGMDAEAFFAEQTIGPPAKREWLFAAMKLALGVVLIGIAVPVLKILPAVPRAWIGMAGIVFVLHFGLFHLLSCWWRTNGIAAQPLMDWPIATTSVSDFWSRRWNIAFRDIAYRFLFRPLTVPLGTPGAMLATFLFSGLVHELVITIPAGGGYGGPTAFFLIQAAALLAERCRTGRAIGLGRGWRGRLFTACVVVGPTPLLFPAPFTRHVVVPFLQAMGVWS